MAKPRKPVSSVEVPETPVAIPVLTEEPTFGEPNAEVSSKEVPTELASTGADTPETTSADLSEASGVPHLTEEPNFGEENAQVPSAEEVRGAEASTDASASNTSSSAAPRQQLPSVVLDNFYVSADGQTETGKLYAEQYRREIPDFKVRLSIAILVANGEIEASEPDEQGRVHVAMTPARLVLAVTRAREAANARRNARGKSSRSSAPQAARSNVRRAQVRRPWIDPLARITGLLSRATDYLRDSQEKGRKFHWGVDFSPHEERLAGLKGKILRAQLSGTSVDAAEIEKEFDSFLKKLNRDMLVDTDKRIGSRLQKLATAGDIESVDAHDIRTRVQEIWNAYEKTDDHGVAAVAYQQIQATLATAARMAGSGDNGQTSRRGMEFGHTGPGASAAKRREDRERSRGQR